MTTNNVHVLPRSPAAARLLLVDSNPAESAIALRALRRLACSNPDIWPVMALVEAADILAHQPIDTVVAGSALDGMTLPDTIRWFAHHAPGTTIVAMLEQPEGQQRREALDAGASYVCSKPDLLVSQLRHEFASRHFASPERPRRMG